MRHVSCGLRYCLAVCIGLSMTLPGAALGSAADDSERPEEWNRRLEMLRSVPYLAASETAADETALGVVIHDAERSYPGYNFYCTLSTGEAFLMDMDGWIAHRWSYPLQQREQGTDHGIFLPNGDVIILKEYRQLVRLDWGSRPLWKLSLPAHHDVALAGDGSFYVILRSNESYRDLQVFFPAIAHIDPDGRLIDRWSAYDHLSELGRVLDRRSFLDTILDHIDHGRRFPGKGARSRARAPRPNPKQYEYFHMNTIGVIPDHLPERKGSPLTGGNLLVCFRNVNQIAVMEKDSYRLLWAWGEGQLEWPHHPTVLENGNILIFDNGVARGYSRIIELDPVEERIVWEYTADPPEDFFCRVRGSAQRLPNGNTLICESDRGKVFEITEEGQIVWMWQNPDLVEPLWRNLNPAGESPGGIRHSEALYRMMRLPTAQVEPLLRRWWWGIDRTH